MQRQSIQQISATLAAVRVQIQTASLSSCDASDIEELLDPLERELQKSQPNVQTLTTYLNSLARSFRADPATRKLSLQLDAAMRGAGIASQWEH